MDTTVRDRNSWNQIQSILIELSMDDLVECTLWYHHGSVCIVVSTEFVVVIVHSSTFNRSS